jgi:hypothetical protein
MSEAIRSATIIAAARLVMLMSGLFMALVPMSAQSAESLQEKPTSNGQAFAKAAGRCHRLPIFTYIMCHLAFGGLPLAASLDAVSAIQSELMPAFSET